MANEGGSRQILVERPEDIISTVSSHDVLTRYASRLAEVQAAMHQARAHATAAGIVAVLAAILVAALALQAHWRALLLPGAIAVVAVQRALRDRKTGYRMWRLKHFYERGLSRIEGDWAGKGVAGEAFGDPDHAYAHDLNLFGEGSLFELLCVGRSGIGQRGLANLLLETGSRKEALARQEAVRELRDRTDLREKVALLGPFEFSESTWEPFARWLDLPPTPFPGALGAILLVTSVLLGLILLALIATGGGAFPWVLAARLARLWCCFTRWLASRYNHGSRRRSIPCVLCRARRRCSGKAWRCSKPGRGSPRS